MQSYGLHQTLLFLLNKGDKPPFNNLREGAVPSTNTLEESMMKDIDTKIANNVATARRNEKAQAQKVRQAQIDAFLTRLARLIANTWMAFFALVLVLVTAPLYFVIDYRRLARFAKKTASVFAVVISFYVLLANPFPKDPILTFVLSFAGFLIFVCDHGDDCFG